MLKRIIFAFSAAALLCAQQTAMPSRAIEALIGKARALEARGRADLAAQTWQQLLTIDPDQQDAIAGLARTARMQGKNAEADAYLGRLRTANPANPDIKQIESIGTAPKKNADLEEASRLSASGQYDKAVAAYRKGMGGSVPPPELIIPYYETLAATKEGWDQATAALQELIRKTPASQDYKLLLGRLYTYRPPTRMKGVALLEQLSGPLAQPARVAWHQALVWENGSARSAESMRSYLSRYPDTELEALVKRQPANAVQAVAGGDDVRRGYLALNNDDVPGALGLFEQALAKNPKHSGALTGIGFVRMKQQDFPAALKSFEAAAAAGPETRVLRDAMKEARFWTAMQQGASALKASRPEEAVECFRKAITEHPDHSEAMEGYAGALMQHGDYSTALPYLERLVKADAKRVRAWKDLIVAKQYTSGAQAALDTIGSIPPAVVSKLSGDLEYLAVLTGIEQRAGRMADARQTFARASALAEKTRTALPPYLEMQLGGLYVNFGDAKYAVKHYRAAIQSVPANLDAWEGFLLASNRAKVSGAALKTLEGLPVSVHEAAQARPGFLRAVAALEASVGSLTSAEKLLNRAQVIETADGRDPSFYTQLQLAQLWLEQGKGQQAAAKFSELSASYPENEEVWKGLVLGLQKSGSYDQALEAVRRIPTAVASVLENDVDYVSAVAGLYKDTNSTEDAARFLREATSRFASQGRTVPPALTIQLAWVLVDKPGSERDLFVLLRNARTRTDYSTEQRKVLNDIWTAWLTRSANSSIVAGDTRHAISILEAGVRMLPAELRLQRALASALLTAGDPKRSTAIYQAAGFREAAATDYVAAVGAAMGAEETRLAQNWMKEGLTQFPRDTELLSLAGKQAAAKGDFRKAEGFWRLALQEVDSQNQEKLAKSLRSGPEGIPDLKLTDLADQAGAVLLSRASSPSVAPAETTQPLSYRLPWAVEPSSGMQQIAAVRPGDAVQQAVDSSRVTDALLADIVAASGSSEKPGSPVVAVANRTTVRKPLAIATKDSLETLIAAVQKPESRADLRRSLEVEKSTLPAPAAPTPGPSAAITEPGSQRIEDLLPSSAPRTTTLAALLEPNAMSVAPADDRDKIMERIKAVENRNTPYVSLGGNVVNRGGQAGFERMMLQESTVESSTVLHGNLRATVVAKSVFADATGPDGQSLYRFGMLPQGDTFSAPGMNGLGAEVQLSGNDFGLRFGTTPRGFLVHNITGGFRYRPGGGPITLMFDRDSVKDTILSYGGAQDPISGRVWGGVMANSGNATGNFGNEKSGAYFNLGFQYLTGQSVETNTRVDGTAGTYWRLAHTSVGSLNAGVNLFAMHYAKNLRYFTTGQGGYFSPQRFYLFNVPVTWTGKSKRFEYVVSSSVGSQSFTEDASPYFPLDPLVQGKNGPYYPKLSSSGINYNFDFRVAYQVAENWFLVGFLNVNNARFYSQQSSGISIRYSFGARPLGTDLALPGIPDWRGRQPFGLQ